MPRGSNFHGNTIYSDPTTFYASRSTGQATDYTGFNGHNSLTNEFFGASTSASPSLMAPTFEALEDPFSTLTVELPITLPIMHVNYLSLNSILVLKSC